MLLIRMNECLRLRVHVLNQMLTLKWPKLMTLPPALSTQPLNQICLTLVARMRRKRRCLFFILLFFFPCITFFLCLSLRVWCFFLVWMKSILPKIFGSKRNGRSSDEEPVKPSTEEEDGVTLGIHYMLSFLSFRRKSKFPCCMVSLWFMLFIYVLYGKIWRRRLRQEKKHFWKLPPSWERVSQVLTYAWCIKLWHNKTRFLHSLNSKQHNLFNYKNKSIRNKFELLKLIISELFLYLIFGIINL